MRNAVIQLKGLTASYGIILSNEMVEQFYQYAEILLEWNQKLNLTAITRPEDIVIKHFLDSLLILQAVELKQGATVIDVGTGAGFPGIPLKIARPDLKLTLLDSLNKRVTFLEAVSSALNQDIICLHARAEVLAHDTDYRECYDFATARAVAALPALCEYCMPYLKTGGYFLAMKGGNIEEESESAKQTIALLGGKIKTIRQYSLPNDNARSVIVIKKQSQTPSKYPRKAVKITKSPL